MELQRPFPIIVKDNFFADPDEIRRWALGLEFLDVKAFNERRGVSESWPGARTAFLHELRPSFVQDLVNHILTNILPLPPCDFRANTSFQLTRAGDGDSWVHTDDQSFLIAGIIYLTPNPPPASGTRFYRINEAGEPQVCDMVGNRYNRLLLFDTQTPHKSDRYFGETLENGRLTLPLFIDFKVKKTAATVTRPKN